MNKKLKPLTIFLSDDELVNFKSHFDEFLNMNCDDKIKEQQQEIERLHSIIKEVREYIENNWINQKDADMYRIDTEELGIEISDIAVLYYLLDKGE